MSLAPEMKRFVSEWTSVIFFFLFFLLFFYRINDLLSWASCCAGSVDTRWVEAADGEDTVHGCLTSFWCSQSSVFFCVLVHIFVIENTCFLLEGFFLISRKYTLVVVIILQPHKVKGKISLLCCCSASLMADVISCSILCLFLFHRVVVDLAIHPSVYPFFFGCGTCPTGHWQPVCLLCYPERAHMCTTMQEPLWCDGYQSSYWLDG